MVNTIYVYPAVNNIFGRLSGYPIGVTVDKADNIYVVLLSIDQRGGLEGSYTKYSTILLMTALGTNGQVTAVAGGANGSTDGLGAAAQFNSPTGIAVDSDGNIYVADTGNSTIRKITPAGTNWIVSTIGGQSGLFDSRDGISSVTLFNSPHGIAADSAGKLYVADTLNNTIRNGVFTAFGTNNIVAFTQPTMTGQLQVTLLPPDASGQWRFPWEVVWHASGFMVTNLAAGNYPVEFRNLPGWVTPASLTTTNGAAVTNGGLSLVTATYIPTLPSSDANGLGGGLTVSLGADPPPNAGWRFLGDTTAFFASGFTTNLLPGTYLIEFAGPFPNRATPPIASVQVSAGPPPTLISVSYPFADTNFDGNAPSLPSPVPSNEISDVTDYPFGFNGQLRTDVGYGSGVVVTPNVVLTAAHLVFNDETLSYSSAYFFLQQEVPSYTPTPLIAQGGYVLSGYASQRTNDLNSGNYGDYVSSPQSRNLDVAVLYFTNAVAGDGFGGYLPSDAVPNTWLTSTANKMLVGYPVDGSQYGIADITNGVMYDLGPQPYPLSLDPESVTNQQEVYLASWFLGYPGDSGGPLYVQLNGYYYPAGVYLGTLNGQSVVRGIDSNVVNLINLAQSVGTGGANNGGGDVINVTANSGNLLGVGIIQVQLSPPGAVAAGATWELLNYSGYATNTNEEAELPIAGQYTVRFAPVPGYVAPVDAPIQVALGSNYMVMGTYTAIAAPQLGVDPVLGLGVSGTIGTMYELQSRTSLTSGSWVPLSTNLISSNGFNPIPIQPGTNHSSIFYRARVLP
jgi:hypothetical protein